MEKRKEEEFTDFLQEIVFRDIYMKIIDKEEGSIIGKMELNLTVPGKPIKWRVRVHLLLKMAQLFKLYLNKI